MELIVKLNAANAIQLDSIYTTILDPEGVETQIETKQYDWRPALVVAALEVQALNQYSGTTEFPTPIPCNPDAMTQDVKTGEWSGEIERFLGLFNTPPTADRGMVTVSFPEYGWIELNLLPAQPATFTIVVGGAPVGKIAS